MRIPVKASVALLCLLAACTPRAVTSPRFGEAEAINERIQIIDPAAHLAETPPPEFDGARAEAAGHRYRDGTVTKPTAPSTSSLSGVSSP